MALGGVSFFVFAVHEPLATIGKKLAFDSLPMTAGTVLETYGVLPLRVICLALAAYWMSPKTVPDFLSVIAGER